MPEGSCGLAGELARVARALHPDGKVLLYEQEEAGCWCRVVEGIEAEVEATGFTEKEVLELLEGSFWVKPAPSASQCMRSRPGPTTTSSFCARCFCIRLQHRLKMML